MALANYDDLKAAVASWLNRTDLTAQIPDFIALAESRLNRSLRLRDEYEDLPISTVAGSRTVPLPADFDEPIALWDATLVDRDPLQLVLPTQIIITTVQGEPEYWMVDDAIYFERPANQVYSLILRYIKKFSLSDANPTNWLLTNHPDAYLFTALEEAGPFLRDPDILNIYAARAERAINEIQSKNNANRRVTLVTDVPAMRRAWDWRRGY